MRFYPIGSIEVIVSPSNLPKLNFKAGRLIGNTIRLNSLTCIIDIIWCLILYNVCHLNQLNVTILLFTLLNQTKKLLKEETFFCFTLTFRIKAEFPHNGKNIPSKSFFRVDIVDTGHKTTFNMCSMFLVFIQILLLSAGTFSSITQKGRDGYLFQGFQAG